MLALNKPKQAPIAVLGAGNLISHLRRFDAGAGREDDRAEYRFNIFRENSMGEVSHSLRTRDVGELVDLCYVVAFAILDDGWITQAERANLQSLLTKLDSIREQNGDLHHG